MNNGLAAKTNRTYHWMRRSREEIKRGDESTSIERQRKVLIEDDEKKGQTKVGELCFPSTMGDAVTDKDLKPLVDAVFNDDFDVLKARDVGRLSRGNMMLSKIRGILEPFAKRLEFAWETYEDTPIGRGLMEVSAAMAGVEKGMSGMRFMEKRKDRANQGYFQGGGLPYGYRYDKEKFSLYRRLQIRDPLAIEYVDKHHPDFTNAGRIELDSVEAPIWASLYHWIDEGKSMTSWVRWFNDSGYRSKKGKKLKVQTVSRSMRNPIYKGDGYWNRMKHTQKKLIKKSQVEVIRFEVPAIVSPQLFDRVMTKLEANPFGKKSPRNTHHFYLLSGLPIYCAECGLKFRFNTKENNVYYYKGVKHLYRTKEPHRYAECYGTKTENMSCRKPHAINLDTLENRIWWEVVAGLFDYVKEGDVVDKLMVQYESQKDKIETDLKKCKGALVDCSLKRTRLLSAIRDNPQWGIGQSNIDLQMIAITEEEERNKAEISKLESLKSNANHSNELTQRLKWVNEEFKTGTIYDFTKVSDEHKKKILNQLIDKVEIDGSNEVTVRLALPKPELADSFVLMSTIDKSMEKRI